MSSASRIMAATLTAALLLLAGCAPSGGETPTPSASESASPSPTTSPTPTAPETRTVPLTLYYVALGDEGVTGEPLGCGDSLVAFTTEPVTTDDVLRSSMERLLADTVRNLGGSGLYSAIPGGTLSYVDGSVDDGTVTVELTGLPAPAGECDNPRIESQLERTAMAATDATDALVLVDGVPIADVLSLK
ncbi:GerMN domain-containing protein [Agromyces bauzanensis]